MNSSDFDSTSPHDDGFDARARSAHAAAQDALSPRVRAQLQQRRRAALAGPRTTHGVRWVPTLTIAATLAVAVGLGLRLWSPAALDSGMDTPAHAQADTPARGTEGTPPGPIAPVDARQDASRPAIAAGRGDAGDAQSLDGAVAGGAGSPRAADAPTGSLDADFDAIAALLAAPAAGDAGTSDDTAGDVTAADVAQDDALLAALEESPDFYLWLGADDGAGVEAL